jgi:hypothetical protein
MPDARSKNPPTPELVMLCLDHQVERWKWKKGTKNGAKVEGETVALKRWERDT